MNRESDLKEADIQFLIKKAIEAREKAYARYSGFKVGAALLAGTDGAGINGSGINDSGIDGAGIDGFEIESTGSFEEDGYRIFTGCNIENSSYGATICAERAAVCNAISHGYDRFIAIAIVGGLNSTGINGITYPCGICRQVLSEFSPDMYVISARSESEYDMRSLSELLPAAFEAGQIK